MAMSGVVAFLWLALQIQGTGDCPTAGEVEARLGPLLPPDFAALSADQAVMVENPDGTLSLSLVRPDGRTVDSRRLPRAASCPEQAATAAVALAVWEAQIHPEISLRLDSLRATPADRTAVAPPPAVRRTAGPAAPPARTFAVGAALLGSWQPGSLAPGGRVDAMLGTVGRGWRWRLSVAGIGEHRLSLPPGHADWWRLYGALGADYALPLGRRWSLALGASGVLGMADASGAGYSNDRTARSVDLGAEALLRVELRLGAVRPWIGVALLAWLRKQTLEVTGAGTSVALPRTEPLIALGADFCAWP
jgi:hypothetical protein